MPLDDRAPGEPRVQQGEATLWSVSLWRSPQQPQKVGRREASSPGFRPTVNFRRLRDRNMDMTTSAGQSKGMGDQRSSNAGTFLAWVGAASVLLAIPLVLVSSRSTMCVLPPADSPSEGGCASEYIIEPFGVRLGEWFGVVAAAILITALLSIIVGAGWLFQLYMDKRVARRLDKESMTTQV